MSKKVFHQRTYFFEKLIQTRYSDSTDPLAVTSSKHLHEGSYIKAKSQLERGRSHGFFSLTFATFESLTP